MKKRSVIISTLALSLLMATSVFAKDTTNNNYSMMGGYNSNYGMTQEQFDDMNEFMEENFGYSMMDVSDSGNRMTQEQFDDMNEFMEENYGYSTMDIANERCNMTQEEFEAMNDYMEENFGYSMMDGYNSNGQGNYNRFNNGNNSGRRSCHN